MSVGMVVSFIALLLILFIAMIVFLNKVMNRDLGAATAHLDQVASDYGKKEEEIKKQFEDLKRQGQQILETAQADAEQQKQRMLKEINEQKDKILVEAHEKVNEMMQQTDHARKALLDEADQKIEERAISRAAELLQEVLPEQARLKIHEVWIENLMANSFTQLDRLHIRDGIKEARVVSAFPLTDAQRNLLQERIKEKLGFAVNLIEEIDAGIIAGWAVTIGDLVLDGSLRFKIQEAAISLQNIKDKR